MKYLLLITLLIVSMFTIALTQSQPQLEYKFVYDCSEKKANALAVDGWELVAIQSPSSSGIANNVSTYVFRRRK